MKDSRKTVITPQVNTQISSLRPDKDWIFNPQPCGFYHVKIEQIILTYQIQDPYFYIRLGQQRFSQKLIIQKVKKISKKVVKTRQDTRGQEIDKTIYFYKIQNKNEFIFEKKQEEMISVYIRNKNYQKMVQDYNYFHVENLTLQEEQQKMLKKKSLIKKQSYLAQKEYFTPKKEKDQTGEDLDNSGEKQQIAQLAVDEYPYGKVFVIPFFKIPNRDHQVNIQLVKRDHEKKIIYGTQVGNVVLDIYFCKPRIMSLPEPEKLKHYLSLEQPKFIPHIQHKSSVHSATTTILNTDSTSPIGSIGSIGRISVRPIQAFLINNPPPFGEVHAFVKFTLGKKSQKSSKSQKTGMKPEWLQKQEWIIFDVDSPLQYLKIQVIDLDLKFEFLVGECVLDWRVLVERKSGEKGKEMEVNVVLVWKEKGKEAYSTAGNLVIGLKFEMNQNIRQEEKEEKRRKID